MHYSLVFHVESNMVPYFPKLRWQLPNLPFVFSYGKCEPVKQCYSTLSVASHTRDGYKSSTNQKGPQNISRMVGMAGLVIGVQRKCQRHLRDEPWGLASSNLLLEFQPKREKRKGLLETQIQGSFSSVYFSLLSKVVTGPTSHALPFFFVDKCSPFLYVSFSCFTKTAGGDTAHTSFCFCFFF